MKKSTKKILILTGVSALFGLGAWIYIKQKTARKVLKKIGVKLRGIDSVKFDFSNFKFRLKMSLRNNTGYDFGLLVGGLTVKEIRVLEGRTGRILSRGVVNATHITFPAHELYDLPPIDVSVGVAEAGAFFLQNKNHLNKITDQLNYEIDIHAFGFDYTIKQ